jgi:acyl-coenzyme A synthetase/AMP-(fatty) acid ligase
MIEKFKVKGLYGSPTAFRSIKKEDNDGHKLK